MRIAAIIARKTVTIAVARKIARLMLMAFLSVSIGVSDHHNAHKIAELLGRRRGQAGAYLLRRSFQLPLWQRCNNCATTHRSVGSKGIPVSGKRVSQNLE